LSAFRGYPGRFFCSPDTAAAVIVSSHDPRAACNGSRTRFGPFVLAIRLVMWVVTGDMGL
jgi:hypothetical protein